MPYFHPITISAEPFGQSHTLPMPIIYERVESSRQKWDYKVVTIDPREELPLGEEQLAELGAEGWLLAGILQHPSERVISRISYYFVRPAEE